VGRRALFTGLLAAVPLADAAGLHGAAFWALVLALPVGVACALGSFGTFLDGAGDAVVSLQALLWIPSLVLLLAAAATRGPAIATGSVPRLGVTALIGCLAVVVLKALLYAYANAARVLPVAAKLN
jgi:hypothetical protein